MKEVRRHFSKIGFIYLLGSVLSYGLQYLWAYYVYKYGGSLRYNYDAIIIGNMLPLFLIVYPLIMFLMSKLPKTEIQSFKCSFGKWFSLAMTTMTIVYASNWIGNYLNKLIGKLSGKGMVVPLANTLSRINLVTVFIFVVVLAPIFEELVFRKTILDHAAKYGEGMAIILSGVMFGLFHGNFSQFMYATTLGMFFAYIYLRTGNIKYTMALHMFVNFMGSFVSVLVLNNIDLDEYQMAFSSGNEKMRLAYMREHEMAVYGLTLFVLVVIGFFIAGIVFFFLNLNKMHLNPSSEPIQKGKKFTTVFINVGMIIYTVAWVGIIIYNQLHG